jgi:Tautomerase enzyme
MPLVRFDIVEGRSKLEIGTLLDAAHRALVAAFDIPARDRYQIVQEHAASHLRAEDTGLDIERTDRIVFISVTTRPRGDAAKLKFYREVCRELQESCGIAASDVIISMTTNTDADWSFGRGRAQFMTGELR